MGFHRVFRAIALGATVLLVGCSGIPGFGDSESKSKAEAKPAASKKASGPLKSVIRDNLIVSGKRIGPVSVGMSVSQLYDVMGEPTQSVKGRGTERYKFDDVEVIVDDVDETVNMVSTDSPEFATADGVKVGVTELAVKATLARLPGQLLIKEEGETTTYSTPGMMILVVGGHVKTISIRLTSSTN